MCKHWECPYRYCPYHKNFSQELLDSAREVIPNTAKSVIPDIEWGQTPENCQSYLDIQNKSFIWESEKGECN